MDTKTHTNYRDHFFEHGHWETKIRQILVALICWLLLFTPIIITRVTYLAYLTHGRRGHFFWYYSEGFQELNFLIVFLTFALGMIAVFCLTMGYVQSQRARGLVNKWPLFDITKNRKERETLERFMTARFGNEKHRQSQQNYTVKPEQNLTKNELKRVINNEEVEADI